MDLLYRPFVLVLLGVVAGCDQPAVSDPAEGASAAERLAVETDPIRRLAILRELARTPGMDMGPICATFDDRALAEECRRLGLRTHLREAIPNPALAGVELPEGVFGPLAGVTPALDQACAGREPDELEACQALRARNKARDLGPRAAAEACAALDRGRDECLFRVAEERMEMQDARGAAQLCLASASLSAECLKHISQALCSHAPPPMLGREEVWVDMAGLIEEAASELEVVGAEQANGMRGRTWAQLTMKSLSVSKEADGAILAQLPSMAHQQYRGALAWRLAHGEQRLGALVEQVLAGARGRVTLGERVRGDASARHLVLWPTLTEEEEEDLTIIPFLMDGWRLSSPDPEVDAAICVLEGYAAKGRVPIGILEEGQAHPSPLVRWTAARLIPPGPEGDALRTSAASDSDPLVRERVRMLQSRSPNPRRAPPATGRPRGGAPSR